MDASEVSALVEGTRISPRSGSGTAETADAAKSSIRNPLPAQLVLYAGSATCDPAMASRCARLMLNSRISAVHDAANQPLGKAPTSGSSPAGENARNASADESAARASTKNRRVAASK